MFNELELLKLKKLLSDSCNGYPNIVENVDETNKSFGLYQVVFANDRLNHFTENDWKKHIEDYEKTTGIEYEGDIIDQRYDTRIRISESLIDDGLLYINELRVGEGKEYNYYYLIKFIDKYAKSQGYKGVRIDLLTKNEHVDSVAHLLNYKNENLSIRQIISKKLNTGLMSFNPLVHYFE